MTGLGESRAGTAPPDSEAVPRAPQLVLRARGGKEFTTLVSVTNENIKNEPRSLFRFKEIKEHLSL